VISSPRLLAAAARPGAARPAQWSFPMGIFSSWFSRKSSPAAPKRRRRSLRVEPLEDRCLPSSTVISGFVFNDVNNNGLFDSGEPPVANATVQLVNSSNQVIGTAITDVNGFYQFTQDNSISQAPQTITQTITIPATLTDFSLAEAINQFDPSLGQLQSISIMQNGTITSTIKAENTSATSPATINAVVSGTMSLSGPGVSSNLNLAQNAGSFNASAYDNVLDFGGTSGFTFTPQAATGSSQVTLSGAALSSYIGTGSVSLTESAQATSSATGGGNLVAQINSNGQATITVTYTYIPANGLKPGNYTIELSQPPGYQPGKESSNGVVLNVPPGTNAIPVTLNGSNSVNNDFGELLQTALSGYVYVDANNNGVMDPGESGLPGIQLALTGTDYLGHAVSQTAFTAPNGFYQFNSLNPGTYSVTVAQPANYLAGKDTAGSSGGVAGNDVISRIVLSSGVPSTNNNFGELNPANLSGFVYQDANDNGKMEPGEPGISGVVITLTGTNDQGAVSQVVVTNASGFYQFSNLRPGTYTLSETPPSGYLQGTNSIGSQGGLMGNNQFSNLVLTQGTQGINNDFAELAPGSLSGYVYVDKNNNGLKDPGEPGVPGVTVILSGTNDQGAVSQTTQTNANGFYQFTNLRPGNYTITEVRPSSYLDGIDTLGTLSNVLGTQGNNVGTQSTGVPDTFLSIPLSVGTVGVNYNFGLLTPPSADLSIVKHANASSVLVNKPLTYTLIVHNLGTSTAQGVVVTDNLPVGSFFVSASSPGWKITQSHGIITATIGSLKAGATDVITVTIRAPAKAGQITNVATVTSNTPDPNPNNNTSRVTTPVLLPSGGKGVFIVE
jgi:uncharacterized repeat protein (TIGR01451 family)